MMQYQTNTMNAQDYLA